MHLGLLCHILLLFDEHSLLSHTGCQFNLFVTEVNDCLPLEFSRCNLLKGGIALKTQWPPAKNSIEVGRHSIHVSTL